MPNHKTLSRRGFLKLTAAGAASALFSACSGPVTQDQVSEPMAKAPQITPTPTELPLIETIFPDMVLVEAGSFEMGAADGRPKEQPVHTVEISRPFYISRYMVTFDEYERFLAYAGGTGVTWPDDLGFGRGQRPVFWIKWFDAAAYCNWLSENAGLAPCYSGTRKIVKWDTTADGYRLPTEAEWEYAARGGLLSQGYLYAGGNDPDEVGWYGANSGNQTHPVGLKKPNELGLYDMSGNIWEWCWDWYRPDYYAESPPRDPLGPDSARQMQGVAPINAEKVRRGGDWGELAEHLRVSARSADLASFPVAGIRPVRRA
jgi:sulfatase modifying factor 1